MPTLFESAALGLVLAALVVRPAELPSLGRKAGRLAGRAVNRFQSMKRELGEYVEKNELGSVHDELEQTMGQLNKIRQDVRSVSSVRGMVMGTEVLPHGKRPGGGGKREVDEGGRSRRQSDPSPSTQLQPQPQPKPQPQPQPRTRERATREMTVLPISARDVQRAHRTDAPNGRHTDESTGSGILKATLEEERVAKTAAQFFRQQQRRHDP